jgi:hypothetical protein
LLGPAAEAAVDELTRRYRAWLSDEVPARLGSRTAELELVQIGRRHVRVDSYRAHDPLKVPKILIGVLEYFDGRDTAEALQRIQAEKGLHLEPALVKKLVDFGLLVDDSP